MTKYEQFYREFIKLRDKYGNQHSIISHNWSLTASTLYQFALMELGVDHCSDHEILPAVFGDNWHMVQQKCLNEYYGFNFCATFCLNSNTEDNKDKTLQDTINQERNHMSRMVLNDWKIIIERRLSEKQLVKYTALGVLLYNHSTEDFEPNPLCFSDEQYETWVNPEYTEYTYLGNCHSEMFESIKNQSSYPIFIQGSPQGTEAYTSEALTKMGMVGMYKGKLS